jgi:hypothetical protein
MKKTCILAHGRTGSSFLTNHFKSIHGYSYCCGEMFNFYVPYHFRVMKRVFADHNLPIPDSHQRFLLRLANSVQDGAVKHTQQKPWFDYQPYRIEMFNTIVKTLNNLGYKHFISKFLPTYSRPYTIAEFFPQIIESCDNIILLYRKSFLDVHISYQRSLRSTQWTTEKYDPEHDVAIEWNLKQYEDRVKDCKEIYRDYFSILKSKNKRYNLVEYNQMKGDWTQTFLKNIDTDYPLQASPIVKQTKVRKNIEDNFKNKEDFLKDLQHLEIEFNIEEVM